MRLAAKKVYLKCLIPRVLLALIFSMTGYLGSGGDQTVYHLLGKYLKDVNFAPEYLSMVDYLERVSPGSGSMAGRSFAQRILAGDYLSSEGPIILAHAITYSIWDNIFAFVVVTSFLSAYANCKFIYAFNIPKKYQVYFFLNPGSVYYAATHNKESLHETIVLLTMIFLYARRIRIKGLLWTAGLMLFRTSHLPFAAIIYCIRYVKNMNTKWIVSALFMFFLLAPSMYWSTMKVESAGPVYSLIYANTLTQKILGPLVGILQPVPFFIVGFNTIEEVYFNINGIFYHFILLHYAVYIFMFSGKNLYVKMAMTIMLIISYYSLGSMAKVRFFTPYMPIMILGFIQIKPMATRKINSFLGKPEPLPEPALKDL